MTLVDVIDNARSLCNEPLTIGRSFPDNTSSFWTDSILIQYFNQVQQEVQNEIIQTFEDYFLTQTNLTIVNGTAQYALPTGFIKVRRVEDIRNPTDPVEILPTGINERGTKGPLVRNTSSTYWPGGYYLKGSYIVFTDTPTFSDTSAITLYYLKSLTDLSAASSVSDIPVEHHPVLVWGLVKNMLFQQQSDTAKADTEYEKKLQRLRSYCEDRQVQRPRRVHRTSGGR